MRRDEQLDKTPPGSGRHDRLPDAAFEYRIASPPPHPGPGLNVVAYNIERGRNLDAIVARWLSHRARDSDVVLLSEADVGMARSANRHVAREFADALGYSWAFAPEFRELTKGARHERRCAVANREALHGNAILSRFPLSDIEVAELPAFFDYRARYMARHGRRIALIADVAAPTGTVTVASTHFEAHSSPAQRLAQALALAEALARRDTGQPMIVGGDLNTTCLDVTRLSRSLLRNPLLALGVPRLGVIERHEPLLGALGERGWQYRVCNRDACTFSDRGYRAHLDWLLVKNLPCGWRCEPSVYAAFAGRRRYSDHWPVALALAPAPPGRTSDRASRGGLSRSVRRPR